MTGHTADTKSNFIPQVSRGGGAKIYRTIYERPIGAFNLISLLLSLELQIQRLGTSLEAKKKSSRDVPRTPF